MDRRKFIKTMGLLSLYVPFSKVNAQLTNRVVVVGAGIVGTCIAYELSNLGIKTVLIDKNIPGSGTSGASFNWINATYPKKPYSYNYLAQLSLNSFKDIEIDLNYPIDWYGSLEWTNSIADQNKILYEVKNLMKYPTFSKHKIINHIEANKLEPKFINFNNNNHIVYSEDDGYLNTKEFIKVLIDKIKFNGSKVIEECSYHKINYINNKISSVSTSKGEIVTDQIVFACGIDTNKIFNKKLIKSPEPGIIIKSKPYKKIINRIIYGPGIHLYQQRDGKIIIGEQGILDIDDKNKLKNYPKHFISKSMEEKYINKIIKTGKLFLKEIDSIPIDEVKIGWRPIPLDEKPIVGRLPHNENIYIATMHSGITLGPIIGKYVAKEISQNTEIPLLNEFRPSRLI